MADDSRSLWDELKDRKVVRVAISYAVVGWAVIEVADTVTPMLALPIWLPKVVLVMVVLGFPIALVLAWAFELTPDGVQRATPTGATGGRSSRLPFVAGVVVGIASLTIVAFLVPEDDPAEPVGPEGLDTNVVAVVPFGFVGPDDLDHLGEGVSYLLAARFTGEIGPRAVDPDAARAHWQEVGGSSAVGAGEIGRSRKPGRSRSS